MQRVLPQAHPRGATKQSGDVSRLRCDSSPTRQTWPAQPERLGASEVVEGRAGDEGEDRLTATVFPC